MTATETPETITRAELEWVLQRHGNHLNAAELIDEIEANRDSAQYEPGAVYEDPEGNKWFFDRALGDDSPHWLRPGLAGSFEACTPRRPLRKLVPLPDRDALIAVLGKTITGDLWERVADRIFALMDGES